MRTTHSHTGALTSSPPHAFGSVHSPLATHPPQVKISTLLFRFAFTAWGYALAVSGCLLCLFLVQAHAYARTLNYTFYDGGFWRWAERDPTKPHAGVYGEISYKPLIEDFESRYPRPDHILLHMAHTSGFYTNMFIRQVANWGNVAGAPPLLFSCLFRDCRFTRKVVLPLLAASWFAYIIVKRSIFEMPRSRVGVQTDPERASSIFLHEFELQLVPMEQRNAINYENLSFWPELICASAFSIVGLLGTLIESRKEGARVAAWSGAAAFILPWMCYMNTAIFNYIIWGGNACPYGAPGALWFKAQTWTQRIIVRFFIVQLVGVAVSYGAKLLTQDQLPLGINFPIKSSVLRVVVPFYFIAFWGLVGRMMQSRCANELSSASPRRTPHAARRTPHAARRTPHALPRLTSSHLVSPRSRHGSFEDPLYAALVEAALVGQEILQMWAYMHQKGPMSYVLSLIVSRCRGGLRNKVAPQEELEKKVAAPPAKRRSWVEQDESNPNYGKLDDIPSKPYTYNFLICAHAVCEAVTVLTAAFIPLAYNANIADYKEIDQGTVITNLMIGLIGETIFADSILCILAARKQRTAHTFLATWQMRPKGSLFAFVAVTVAAFCPIWHTVLATQTIKKDSSQLGYHSYPQMLFMVDQHRHHYNRTQHGLYTTKSECGGDTGCLYSELLTLRVLCGAPPGELSNKDWCIANNYPIKCCTEMFLFPKTMCNSHLDAVGNNNDVVVEG